MFRTAAHIFDKKYKTLLIVPKKSNVVIKTTIQKLPISKFFIIFVCFKKKNKQSNYKACKRLKLV